MIAAHENYLDFFADAVQKNLSEMAGISGDAGAVELQETVFSSRGSAIIMGITGTKAGRIVIDMDWPTAKALCDAVNGEEILDEEFVQETLAEFTNVVSGHAVSGINNAYPGMRLMLTPPSAFHGDNLSIVSPKLTTEVVGVQTSLGTIFISVGFEAGS